MNTSTRTEVILDTSVLVNFLAIDRIDLLASHARHRFLITAHVSGEVTHAIQSARLATALQCGQLKLLPVGTHAELATFAKLTAVLGVGESAAIAAAVHRSLQVAVEDRVARRAAESLVGSKNVLSTRELMVSIIQCGILTVVQADAIKTDWEANHRFALPQFQSFADILPP